MQDPSLASAQLTHADPLMTSITAKKNPKHRTCPHCAGDPCTEGGGTHHRGSQLAGTPRSEVGNFINHGVKEAVSLEQVNPGSKWVVTLGRLRVGTRIEDHAWGALAVELASCYYPPSG